jgi:phosphoribosylanthranilate isomerase
VFAARADVPVEVKFCGLTRPADAALGAALGAGYLGVVFAESPRRVDAAGARAVFAGVTADGPRRVGVFGAEPAEHIARMATEVGLDVVQLHGDPRGSDVRSLRACFAGEIWAARRIAGDSVPDDLEEMAEAADALLVDTRVGNGRVLGGSGTTFDWDALADRLRKLPRVIVAGGLTPDNVERAIELLSPSVVDVSSGVERSPGIKDETLMRAFVAAVGATAK